MTNKLGKKTVVWGSLKPKKNAFQRRNDQLRQMLLKGNEDEN